MSKLEGRAPLLEEPIGTAVAVALYLKSPLPLYAADVSSTDQLTLEEIVVTGTRRSESIQI